MESDEHTDAIVKSFKLQGTGLARVLGELEAPVMEAVWQLREATVQDVCDALGPGHNYKTVSTVLNRLVGKELLSRRRISKAYTYSAIQPRTEFLTSVSRRVIGALLRELGSAARAEFVEVLSAIEPELLAELERLAHEKREGK